MAGGNSFKSQTLPMEGDIPSVLLNLEYDENMIPKVFEIDLNNDKQNEIIIQSASSLCGTGGCVYILIEGHSKTKIGELFGSPLLITDKIINNFPVIQIYNHLSAESGNYSVFVYNGKKFDKVSSVYLTGESVQILLETIKDNFRLLKSNK